MSGAMAPLLTVQCRHDYFADGLCRPLKLEPTPACARILARYQLHFRPIRGGGVVYYQPGVSPLHRYTETAPLAFRLVNHDPALASYTALGALLGAPADVYYFDNLGVQADAAGNFSLHPAGPLTAPRLTMQAPRFSVAVAPPVRAAALRLRSRLAGADAPDSWRAVSPAVPLSRLAVAAGVLEEGRYRLEITGRAGLDLWLSAEPQPAWGLVAIYPGGRLQFDQSGPTVAVIASNGAVRPGTYTIDLTALSLPWRYCIVGALGQVGTPIDFSQYALEATPRHGQPLLFNGEQGETVGGKPVYRFVSPLALPLAERPGDAFSVKLRPREAGGQAPPMRLSYPQPRNISAPVAGQRYADIFIHL